MSDRSYTHQRPVGVTILMVLLWIEALVGVISGIYLIIAHDNTDLIIELGRSQDTILAYGIAALIIGLVTAWFASALGRGNNFARIVIALIAFINVLSGIYSFFALDGVTRANAILSLILAGIVLYILFGEKGSEEFFES